MRKVENLFYDGPELLDEILTAHPDVEFVQLQINYQDWEDKSVQSRANYEVARKHGKPIVVMEPVKGGSLANPPKAVQEILKKVNPDASFASWAIRFVASLEGILSVLSGMSNVKQMEDNLSYKGDGHNVEDCIACGQCEKVCPQKIQIIDELKECGNTL